MLFALDTTSFEIFQINFFFVSKSHIEMVIPLRSFLIATFSWSTNIRMHLKKASTIKFLTSNLYLAVSHLVESQRPIQHRHINNALYLLNIASFCHNFSDLSHCYSIWNLWFPSTTPNSDTIYRFEATNSVYTIEHFHL